ncbi:unnamed protein product [Cunninghamella blakesleeana]
MSIINKEQVLTYIEQVKGTLQWLFILLSNYIVLANDTFISLWPYKEFRIAVYLFIGLSAVPSLIFLLFCTCMTTIILFIATGTWFILSTIALIFLLPFIIGSLILSIGCVLVYQLYIYFNITTKEMNDLSSSLTKKE